MADRDPLKEYRAKKDLNKIPEPSDAGPECADMPLYVIQKHDASHLHYDLRLEIAGVLKSWALPKGPSTHPREKRLAIPTEDHPLEYATFEGVIPEGEYGAGTVLIWDRGTYRNLTIKDGQEVPPELALARGHIVVWLEGVKLKGGYALTRTRGGKEETWLLVKMKDAFADDRRDPVATEPKSVQSGRNMDEIARNSRG